MNALGSIHNFRQCSRGLNCSNVLWTGSPKFISHAVSSACSNPLQFCIIVCFKVWSSNDTRKTNSAQSKKLVVEMPILLKYSVVEINAGLSVVGSCSKMYCSFKSITVAFKFCNVNLRQVTECLVTQQDFYAGVTALKPRCSSCSSLTIYKSWLTPTSLHHQSQNMTEFLSSRFLTKHQAVVALCSLLITFPPIPFSYRELLPFIFSVIKECNLSTTSGRKYSAQPINQVKNINPSKERTRTSIKEIEYRCICFSKACVS